MQARSGLLPLALLSCWFGRHTWQTTVWVMLGRPLKPTIPGRLLHVYLTCLTGCCI
jgi:hypothetical protein